MRMMEAVKSAFNQYATFSGRARRSEYWYFCLFNFLIGLALGIVSFVIDTDILSTLYSLAVLIPGLAVCVRRLHDVGKSGWWYFIVLIPIIGWVWMLILLTTDSKPDNEYGPNPKAL